MNDAYIIHMIEPFVILQNKITFGDFEKAFSMLTTKEQYQISDLLVSWGFELIDEDVVPNLKSQYQKTVVKGTNIKVTSVSNILSSQGSHTETLNSLETVSWKEKISLTNEQLCYMHQHGDKTALGKLIVRNRRFVYSKARHYLGIYNHKLDLDDLVQAGYLGLISAADKFDVSSGYVFLTYAGWWIVQRITRTLVDEGFTIRLPVHMFEKVMRVHRIESAHLGEDIDGIYKSIFEDMGIEREEIDCLRGLRDFVVSPASLNATVGDEGESELIDFIPGEQENPEEDMIRQIYLEEMKIIIKSRLTDREYKVLMLRMGFEDDRVRTLEEIGEVFGVTRERIRQIETKALRKLREYLRKKKFD